MERYFGGEAAFLSGNEVPLAGPVPSQSLIQRYVDSGEFAANQAELTRAIESGSLTNEQMAAAVANVMRGITTSTTAFPVRENLDAEVHIMTPVETPLRNRLPRTPGAGTALKWKQQTAFGAGLGTQTTTTGTTNATNTIVVVNANGFFAGETVTYAAASHSIVSINYSTNIITLGASPGVVANSQTNGQTVVKTSAYFPETAVMDGIFYGENGAPTEATTVYADKTASYKLLGTLGSVTMFAAAAGANFMDQYAIEKRNTLSRLLIKEEFALLYARTDTNSLPWGDGSSNLAYLGLIPWIQANVAAANLQTSVGALTTNHINAQLTRLWYGGGRGMYIMCSGQEATSMMRLAENSGNYRLVVVDQKAATIGGKIAYFIHAVSGEQVPIIVHTFLAPGTMVFGSDRNAHGQATAEVSVLPQANMPDSVDQVPFGGYYAQDIAPSVAAPEKLNFLAKVYAVPQWKNAQAFALSTGVTPVS